MKQFCSLVHVLCLTVLFVTHFDALSATPMPGLRRAVERLSDAQFSRLPGPEFGVVD